MFTKLAASGALSPGNFVANSTGHAVDRNDFIAYETDTGKLYYDADGSGAGAAVLVAVFNNQPQLNHLDFMLG